MRTILGGPIEEDTLEGHHRAIDGTLAPASQRQSAIAQASQKGDPGFKTAGNLPNVG
jgi:hypothetical protein